MTDQLTIEELLAENPINEHPEPRLYSRANGGEVAPGAVTPLTADFYRATSGASMCMMLYAFGAFSKEERGPAADGSESSAAGKFAQFIFGRLSSDFEFTLDVLARVPGVDAAAIEEQLTGQPSTRARPKPTLGQSARAGSRIVWLMLTLERRVDRYLGTERDWWRAITASLARADLAGARRAWREAVTHMRHGMGLQCMVAATHPGAVEPVMKMVRATSPDLDATAVVSGAETLEATVLRRLWDVSRGDGTLSPFLDEFGFYGPGGGELASLSWRQDPAAIRAIVSGYERLPNGQSPAALMEAQHRRALAERARFFDQLPAARRRLAQALVRRADRMTELRERGKTLIFMGADAARAAAVRIGTLLAEAGVIDEALDVFYLTADELASVSTDDRRQDAVAARRRLREAYAELEIPINFQGGELHDLVRGEVERRSATPVREVVPTTEVRGDGVSPGSYTGVARIIRDPGVEMLEPGAVLVCVSTDPGWAPLMTFAGAIVLDLGSMLSHGAIVARELGIPCVANTVNGSTRIPDGALVIVDGSAGTVQLVDP